MTKKLPLNLLNVVLQQEQDTLEFGKKIASLIEVEAVELIESKELPFVIFLKGELGAGKTTFVRGFLEGFGYKSLVKSPTFTLVEDYHFKNFVVYHFDLYRLKTSQELENIGIWEYFSNDSIVLIEWPEKGLDHLPSPDLTCEFFVQPLGRKVELLASSEKAKNLINLISI